MKGIRERDRKGERKWDVEREERTKGGGTRRRQEAGARFVGRGVYLGSLGCLDYQWDLMGSSKETIDATNYYSMVVTVKLEL